MKPCCISCGQAMILEKKGRPVNIETGNKKDYNIKRYVCSLCNYTETKYGSGGMDSIIDEKFKKSLNNENTN